MRRLQGISPSSTVRRHQTESVDIQAQLYMLQSTCGAAPRPLNLPPGGRWRGPSPPREPYTAEFVEGGGGCSSAQLLKQLRTLEAAARLVQRGYRGYRGRCHFYKVAESIAYDA